MTRRMIGLFGGTFDPIHLGHLHLAKKLLSQLPLEAIQFIPCQQSPTRTPPIASAADRVAMIQLAIQNFPQWLVNDIETHRAPPSYTIETIKQLKAQSPDTLLSFILSTDAFSHFNQWREWQAILHYCHLVVVHRTDFLLQKETWMTEFLAQHEIHHPEVLIQHRVGKIIFQDVDSLPIRATEIRKKIAAGHYPTDQVPDVVIDYIRQHHL